MNRPDNGPGRLRILIVSSVGGHLREALELLPALGRAELRFILNDPASSSLGELPGLVATISHAERDLRVAWNLVEVAAVLWRWRWRPDVLLSTGAGPVVPAALLARPLGAFVLFIETFAAVDRPSLTGRLMAPLADRLFVQWPTLLTKLRGATCAGPVFRRAPDAEAGDDGSVLVAVGTSDRPFDRLLRAVDRLCGGGALTLPGFVQRGPRGYAPVHLPSAPLLPAPELEERVRRARLVICHAGAGLLGTCLRHGKRPVVLPREGRLGEHVDDHQLMLARALADAGQIHLAADEDALAPAIAAALGSGAGSVQRAGLPPSTLHDEVATLLRQIAARRGREI